MLRVCHGDPNLVAYTRGISGTLIPSGPLRLLGSVTANRNVALRLSLFITDTGAEPRRWSSSVDIISQAEGPRCFKYIGTAGTAIFPGRHYTFQSRRQTKRLAQLAGCSCESLALPPLKPVLQIPSPHVFS